jgi:hypothetical protein
MLGAAKQGWLKLWDAPVAEGVRLAQGIDWSTAKPGRPTLLCLERSQFIKDIEELRSNTNLNWVTLNAVTLKHRQERWVPEEDRRQGLFSTWLHEERCGHMLPVLERMGVALLTEAQRRMKIDAVVSANIDYWQDESMKLACRRLGIPFLVLCRENYTIPWTGPWMRDYLQRADFRFEGAGVAVFSESTKEALAPIVDDPADIWITGAPRYDRWLHTKPLPDSEKTFLSLITFNDPGYLAANTFLEVAEIFDRVARAEDQPGLTWLVKCKKKGDREEVLERVGSLDGSPLKFEYDTPLFELYPRSRVVVGYNSLALVETMLTDAPLVVPCWGEARPPRSDLLLDCDDPLTRRVATFAETPAQFEDLLVRAARGEKLMTGTPDDRRALFRAHLHDPSEQDPDSTASAKTEAFVRHYVDRARLAKAG